MSDGQQPDGAIFRLSEGFILIFNGHSIACKDAAELGRQATRLAKRKPKAQAAPQSQPGPVGPIPEEKIPMPTTPPPDPYQLQLQNLYTIINARFMGQISPEDFDEYVAAACPLVPRQEVVAAMQQAEQFLFETMKAQASKDGPIGPACQCPGCTMNVSAPNAQGLCVGCFKGEHEHPPPGYQAPKPQAPPPQKWWWEEQEEGDGSDVWPDGADGNRSPEGADRAAAAGGRPTVSADVEVGGEPAAPTGHHDPAEPAPADNAEPVVVPGPAEP